MNFFEELGSFGSTDAFKNISESVFGDNIANDTVTALFDAGAKSSMQKEQEERERRIRLEKETSRMNELSIMSKLDFEKSIQENKSTYAVVLGFVVIVIGYFIFKRR